MKPPKAIRLPSGNWNVRLRIKGREYSITKATEAAAVAEAMAIKAGLKQDSAARPTITLFKAMNSYIEKYRATLSASTIRGYCYIRDHRFQTMMTKSLVYISRDEWQAAIDRERRAVSAKSVKNAWGFVTAVIRDQGLVVPAVKLPVVVRNEHAFLTAEQIPLFLKAIRNTTIEIPALLGLHSLRRSEILSLRWIDVDTKQGIIKVRGASVFDENHELVRQDRNKTAASRRDIPIMIPRLLELLRGAPRTSEFVFNGGHNQIWTQVNRICESAGLPRIGAHGLRHSFASLAHHLGMPEETAMKIGGWSDFTTMRKIYTHISERDQAEKVLAMRNFFEAAEQGIADDSADGQSANP